MRAIDVAQIAQAVIATPASAVAALASRSASSRQRRGRAAEYSRGDLVWSRGKPIDRRVREPIDRPDHQNIADRRDGNANASRSACSSAPSGWDSGFRLGAGIRLLAKIQRQNAQRWSPEGNATVESLVASASPVAIPKATAVRQLGCCQPSRERVDRDDVEGGQWNVSRGKPGMGQHHRQHAENAGGDQRSGVAVQSPCPHKR